MSAKFSRLRLLPPFQSYARHGRWDLYAQALDHLGPFWLLEMHFPRLAVHVEPLLHLPNWTGWTPRLRFFAEAQNFSALPERAENFFQSFQEQGDPLAAAGVVSAAVMALCHHGNALQYLHVWDQAAADLLANTRLNTRSNTRPWPVPCPVPVPVPESVPCRTALLCMRAVAQIVSLVRIDRAVALLEQVVLDAEDCAELEGPSLLVLTVALRGLCNLLQGNLSELDLQIAETTPFLKHNDLSPIAQAMFQVLAPMMKFFQGAEVVSLPHLTGQDPALIASFLPAPVGVLHALPPFKLVSHDGAVNQEKHVVPACCWKTWMDNHSGRAWLHFFNCLACISGRDYPKALAHGRITLEHGEKSGDHLVVHLGALPVARVMGELGMIRESQDMLLDWVERWRTSGMDYFAACGSMELAALFHSRGKEDRARELCDQAKAWTALGDELLTRSRPKGFLRDLQRGPKDLLTLESTWAEPESAAVKIQTLGGFSLQVRGRLMPEARWRAARTKLLLKALVVHGGTKVSRDLLLDLLWPEADGDMALNNFKVAISRLRSKVASMGGARLNWLVVAEGRVSLVKSACSVDCLRFQEAVRKITQGKPSSHELLRTLDLYRDDFLPSELEGFWIENYRQRLRNEYARCVILFAKRCLQKQVPEQGLEYLLRLVPGSSATEEVFALLMQSYLAMGFPSEAMQIFRQARLRLKREYDTLPGAVLLRLARQAREQA